MNILEVEGDDEDYADKLTEKEKTSSNFLNLNTEVINYSFRNYFKIYIIFFFNMLM